MPPKEIVAWVTEEAVGGSGRVSVDTANKAYRAMNSHFPHKAPEFLAELSNHESARSALRDIVNDSVKKSPELIGDWLEERAEDESLNKLRATYLEALKKYHP